MKKSKLMQELDEMYQEAVSAIQNFKFMGKRFDGTIPHVTRVIKYVAKVVKEVEAQGERLSAIESRLSPNDTQESDRSPEAEGVGLSDLRKRVKSNEERLHWLEEELSKRDAKGLLG